MRINLRTGFVVLVFTLMACGSNTASSPAPTPAPAPVPPAAPSRRLLLVTHTTGFRHSSIATAEKVVQEIGSQSGLFTTVFCRTGDDVRRLLTTEGLRDIDAVFFANTTGNLGIPDLGAFLAWVQAGHGFLGAHSASDTYHDEPRYIEMLGGEFLTHGDQTTVDLVVENATHPAVAHLAPRFRILDEIYEFTTNNRSRVQVLLSIDRHPDDGHPEAGRPGDFLMAWTKSYGTGRVFYTALGHREDVWESAAYRQHIRGAIGWALGQ